MADIEGLKNALVQVETVLDVGTAELKLSVAALDASHLPIDDLLRLLVDMLAWLRDAVNLLDPDALLRDEVLALVDDVTIKVDALRVA